MLASRKRCQRSTGSRRSAPGTAVPTLDTHLHGSSRSVSGCANARPRKASDVIPSRSHDPYCRRSLLPPSNACLPKKRPADQTPAGRPRRLFRRGGLLRAKGVCFLAPHRAVPVAAAALVVHHASRPRLGRLFAAKPISCWPAYNLLQRSGSVGLTFRGSGAQFGTNFLCNFTPENGLL